MSRVIAAEVRQLVACALKIPADVITSPRRGSKATVEARHVAMYLMHVSGGLSMSVTGTEIARDRRAVAYAARTLELRRDTDPAFDAAVSALEASLRRRLAACRLDSAE
jgi:chromosomal replication initiation ATPase DnaA